MTTSQKFTDTDGDTLRLSLATPAEQFPNGSIIVRADEAIDGESAAVRMTADHLRGMIDAVSPPIDYADGGVTAAAIEQETTGINPAHLQHALAAALARTHQLDRDLTAQMERAENAEQERDEWEKIALTAERDADEAEENPRTLTADELTDEAIRRARVAWLENAQNEGIPSAPTIRAMFAALTPPPPRPEGAEDMESFLTGLDYLHDETGASRADLVTLANDLALLIVEQGAES